MSLRNFSMNLDDSTYQAALKQAQRDGKTLEQVMAEFITTYAGTGGEVEEPAGAAPTTYTVQRGDTLSKIAGKVYGDTRKYPLIQKANAITDPSRIQVGQVLVIPPLASGSPPSPAPTPPPPSAPAPVPVPPPPTPGEGIDPSAPIPGESYGTLPVVGPPTDRPAAQHGDINLALRGYSRTTAKLGLIDMGGPTDNRAPQLVGLFADKRTPAFSSVYHTNNWDWGSNSRGGPVTDFEVTVAGFAAKPGETIHVPDSGYSIGSGYAVLVLYAEANRITLKYTGEDNVVKGYTLHVEGIGVEPRLLALYQQLNAAGRRQLPALRAGQAFGRARGNEVQVGIRDTGRFMDPRVRKDWWRGK